MAGEQLALYREWRPQCFRDVVGQEHVCRTLKNAIVFGRLAHAYLFCGPRGTGKTSMARILAKAVNCTESRDGEPCNRCESCRRITAGTAFDVLEMDAASHRGIEEIRDLRQKVGFAAVGGKYKFYIIDEVHMLTGEAFNALLKTLEEPPQHTAFVLATTEAHKVPATILSRCQRFDFRRLGRELIAAHLKNVADAKGWVVEPNALDLISRRAGGALRDALGLLDQAASFTGGQIAAADVESLTGMLGEADLKPVLDAVLQGDLPAVLNHLDSFSARGCEPRQVLFQLTDQVREALFAARSTTAEVARYATVLRGLAFADAEMRGSSRPDLILELALLRLSDMGQKQRQSAAKPSVPNTGKDAPEAGNRSTASTGPVMRKGEPGAVPGGQKRETTGVSGGTNRVSTGDASVRTSGARKEPGGAVLPDRCCENEKRTAGLESVREVLQNCFRKHPMISEVLTRTRLARDGNRILLQAASSFDELVLQKEENRRQLREALRKFERNLELEIVAGEDASPALMRNDRGDGSRERALKKVRAGQTPEKPEDPVVSGTVSLFDGEIIKRREDNDR